MAARPLVGVAGMRSARVRGLRSTGLVAAEAVVESVARAGGEPVVLHSLPFGRTGDRLERLDGLVIPGGADVEPAFYGDTEVHEATQVADPIQDAADLALARTALAMGMPLLAICRGMQMVNVAAGGTLQQHLDDGPVDHHGRHGVTLDRSSQLAAVLGATAITVSSYHHQAVQTVAPGFRAVGWAEDGCVEVIESPAHRALCVQWHPEDDAAAGLADHALFQTVTTWAAQRLAERDHRAHGASLVQTG